MKKIKLLFSTVCMFGMCGLGLLADVNANARSVVYDIGGTSTSHSYRNVGQYFKVTATVTIIGDNRKISNEQSNWYSGGTGGYRVSHDQVKLNRREDTYLQYTGNSTIDVGGTSETKNLVARVSY